MSEDRLVAAHRLLAQAVAELIAASGPAASDEELLAVLSECEDAARTFERVSVGALADLGRRGTFLIKGYTSTTKALADLLGMEWADARRRVLVAGQAAERVALDGTVLPATLTATAKVFAAGGCSARQVEVVARVLSSDAARRLTPDVWAAAEEQIAAKAGDYSPTDLQAWGTALVETLDQDGPEPEDRPPAPGVNELFLTRDRSGSGGKIKGRFDDPALYDAIARVVDAGARPVDAADAEERSLGQRQAEALADACGYVLDHADAEVLPAGGGERPHLTVIVRLEDLENRARAACLDLGGPLSPESLRMLCCDARVVPVVLGGAGQPLDVGRATRVIPDGLRRAIAARDRGCARCGRAASWCEIHHIVAWNPAGKRRWQIAQWCADRV
ncbi:DUF222 domain-containing protein, partial [Pseudonocardia sp.]|uniref:HNH endonuclease signature motif containing protein n=1 Tax=Pseudonocardia sp. TaxID=60912 RepID=UPI003D133213